MKNNNNNQYVNFFVNVTPIKKNNDTDTTAFPHYIKAVVINDDDIENFINDVMSQEYYFVD